jgi:FkbM family methyltransferase
MKDYSQSGEQPAILNGLEARRGKPLGTDAGSFLDIGAWHPTQFSNTRALYEAGWSGVMFEPSPGPMLDLLSEYGNEPRIQLVQAGVSVYGGLAIMHVTNDAVSTTSEPEYDKWKNQTTFFGKLGILTVSVKDVFDRYGGFEFVNIDAEGLSADIFLQMLKLGIFPYVVCVEHESRTTEILTAATPEHYRAVLVNQTNAVLVR